MLETKVLLNGVTCTVSVLYPD